MSRIKLKLNQLISSNKKAKGIFLTNGFPELESTVPLLQAIEAGGADFIELGMPFSDPLAEGPPIQRSSARALAGGVHIEDIFRTTRAFRKNSDLPLLLMGYVNPILQYGVRNFCKAAQSSGVDGFIIPDLPPEEASLIIESANDHNLCTVLLIAPNTSEDRVREIDRISEGFVYAVSVTGITGTTIESRMHAVEQYLLRVKKLIRYNPLIVGFGIRTSSDAIRLCRHADGFVVGSELVRFIEAQWDSAKLHSERILSVQQFVRNLSPLS